MSHPGFRHLLTIGWLAAVLAIPATAGAQYPIDVLHEFTGHGSSEGPKAPLIEGRDGNLYGTSRTGGRFNLGTVFRMSRAGTVSVLHSFSGGLAGAYPTAALLEATDGNLYGTAEQAFSAEQLGGGAIFKISPAGDFSVLHIFTWSVFSLPPFSPLVQGRDGNFYGTVSYGGSFQAGQIFRLTPVGEFTVLHEFSGSGGGDGALPVALVQGTDGYFYGTTTYGGVGIPDCSQAPFCGTGTVFRMSPAGTVTIMHTFAGGNEGANPLSALTQANDGNFYGTTNLTAFRITPDGNFTTMSALPAGESGDVRPPPTSITEGTDGRLYGTAADAVFQLSLQGAVTVLHRFTTPWDGLLPLGLVQASDGRFYGTTAAGGIDGLGTAFAMDTNGTTTTLHRFTGSVEGALPNAPLVQASDGHFYGTTALGGLYNFGTIYRVTPSGGFATLYTFSGAFDGGHPDTALVQGLDGQLYGTTPSQGAFNEGVMFRVTLDGRFTTLHAFNHVLDVGRPQGLTLGADGNFYGTSWRFGTSDRGAVYRATPDGRVTVLHAFTGGGDGEFPSALTRGSDGHFYGAASKIAFRVTTAGTFTVLGYLDVPGYSVSLLAQGADGSLYGATLCGDARGGVLFRMFPDGYVTALAVTDTYCSDYIPAPMVTLTRGTDGMLYGTISGVLLRSDLPPATLHKFESDSVFRIDPAGTVTVLGQLGSGRGVIQAADGNLYGTSGGDARFGAWPGTVFRLNLHRPLAPASVVATPSGPNQVTLRWTAVAGAASYIVRRIVPGQAPTVVASGLRATSVTVPLVASNANASYTVTALNADGESVGSTPINLPWGSPASRTPTITTVRDYDGDGKADFTVYRSATGEWLTLQSSNTGLASVPWGAPALLDRPVAADYDGDGKADVAVYRETTGGWFIHRSSDGALSQTTWGFPTAGDLPVPADYDGDGRADLAVFRATTGEWFVHRSSDDTVMQLAWGSPALGDLPVPADYDGDGRADIAVYRGTTGEWFVHQSSNGAFVQFAWGSPAFGDVPVPADYDGDGRTDAAVYRSATAEWFIAYAAGGTAGYVWGSPALTDLPVPADYDGDGRADVAVYRFSTGEWFVRRNGQQPRVEWGAPFLGDAVRKY